MKWTIWLGLMTVSVAALIPAVGCHRQQPVAFPHRAHVATAACGGPDQLECASCFSCHGAIRDDERRPTDPVSRCRRCHEKPDAAVAGEAARLASASPRQRSIVFTHAEHLTLESIRGQCMHCHQGVVHDGATGRVFPTMPECLSCHEQQFARGDCTKCHQRKDLAKQVPRSFMRHDLAFVRRHGGQATARSQVCAQCHSQSDCIQCHDQSQSSPVAVRRADEIDRSLLHRADFLVRHGVEARSTGVRCLRCHTTSSCDSCHVERGVSAGRVGSVNPHPRGWIGPDSSSPDYHGRAARRNIVSCAGCHDQGPATNCIRCHRVGGFAGNPHPSGWKSSRETNQGMCQYCHGN